MSFNYPFDDFDFIIKAECGNYDIDNGFYNLQNISILPNDDKMTKCQPKNISVLVFVEANRYSNYFKETIELNEVEIIGQQNGWFTQSNSVYSDYKLADNSLFQQMENKVAHIRGRHQINSSRLVSTIRGVYKSENHQIKSTIENILNKDKLI